jgi:hypothetical protein
VSAIVAGHLGGGIFALLKAKGASRRGLTGRNAGVAAGSTRRQTRPRWGLLCEVQWVRRSWGMYGNAARRSLFDTALLISSWEAVAQRSVWAGRE